MSKYYPEKTAGQQEGLEETHSTLYTLDRTKGHFGQKK